MSLRRLLSLFAIVLGGLGILLAELTGWGFRELALESQRRYVAELVAVESEPLLQRLTGVAESMVLDLHKEAGFDQALSQGEQARLRRILDAQFHQYYVTAEVVRLGRLALLDPQLRPWVLSSESRVQGESVCPETLGRLRARRGVARIRTAAALCFVAGRPWWLVVKPVGGLSPKGYVQLLLDPVPQLLKLKDFLRLPVALHYGVDQWHYGEGWPEAGAGRWLLGGHRLEGEGGVLEVWAAKDVRELLQRLNRLSWVVGGVGLVFTLLIVVVLWRVLDRQALQPLDRLRHVLGRLVEDKDVLGQRLDPQGVEEVRALTESFNRTSEELESLYDTLERMAYTDSLTRLPNRSRFNEMLDFHVRLNRHRHAPFAVFLMDLDRFKWVNDNLGHVTGDLLLAEVGQRLASVLRKSDVLSRVEEGGEPLARLGGDEFAALIPGVRDEHEAAVVAGKLVSALERPIEIEGRELQVGISIGIALSPHHGKEAGQLMRLADVAMYQAKHSGRDWQVYDEASDQLRRYRDTLEGALRASVCSGEGLSLVYQPQVNVCSHKVVGVEALLRWQGPEGKPVSPAEFVPLAEQCGLMGPLTRWVLDRALEQMRSWRSAGRDFRVSVNLSAHNLAEMDFAKQVERALGAHGLPASCLCLEITETQLVAEPEHALAQLHRLAQMGVHLSLDDFGTGYSSLAYLQRMPLHEIKIDRRFVTRLTECPEDRVIVEAVVGLARGLGMTVLAEGVEDLRVMEALRAMGCRLVQGYFISPPLAADGLASWFAEWEGRFAGRASS